MSVSDWLLQETATTRILYRAVANEQLNVYSRKYNFNCSVNVNIHSTYCFFITYIVAYISYIIVTYKVTKNIEAKIAKNINIKIREHFRQRLKTKNIADPDPTRCDSRSCGCDP